MPSLRRLAALALPAFAMLPALSPASGAAVRAEARALIQNGIAVRTAAADTNPKVEAPAASVMAARSVVRPCRKGEAGFVEHCRFVLLEIQ
jgi:hypothetical protein